MTYVEKLRDPRWQKKRLEIMQRDDFTCCNCGDRDSTLNVDHKIYYKGFDPWDYDDLDLQTLCVDCHKQISITRQNIAKAVGHMNTFELDQLIAFMNDAPIGDEVLVIQNDHVLKIDINTFNLMTKLYVSATKQR